jgi:hypothetical protein
MKLFKLMTGAALFTGIAFLSDGASADLKAYPGAQCARVSGGTFDYFAGTVMNTSSASDLNVICPLVRDVSSISSARIVVFDRHPTLNVSCTMNTETAVGSNFTFVSQTRVSAGFGSNLQNLNFTALGANEYYYATCSIPRVDNGNTSHVASIRVVELGNGDSI